MQAVLINNNANIAEAILTHVILLCYVMLLSIDKNYIM